MVNIPIKWTDELEDAICNAIATNPISLPDIAKKFPEFPTIESMYQRIHSNKSFAEKYMRAKHLQVTAHAEKLMEIADDTSRDHGDEAMAAVQRDRLRSDKRSWYIARLAPRIFGDQVTKKIPFKIDLTKSLNELSQQIVDELTAEKITLDEAQGAFVVLKNYAELVKVTDFEKSLEELKAKLEDKQNALPIGGIKNEVSKDAKAKGKSCTKAVKGKSKIKRKPKSKSDGIES
jgi:terminase small subunit-like protein